jgi:hypothetical protein
VWEYLSEISPVHTHCRSTSGKVDAVKPFPLPPQGGRPPPERGGGPITIVTVRIICPQ